MKRINTNAAQNQGFELQVLLQELALILIFQQLRMEAYWMKMLPGDTTRTELALSLGGRLQFDRIGVFCQNHADTSASL